MYLIYILIPWALSRSVRSQHLVHRQCLMNLSDNSDLVPGNFLFCELGIASALPVSQDSGKYEIRLFREISCVDLLSICCSVQAPCRALGGKLQSPSYTLFVMKPVWESDWRSSCWYGCEVAPLCQLMWKLQWEFGEHQVWLDLYCHRPLSAHDHS